LTDQNPNILSRGTRHRAGHLSALRASRARFRSQNEFASSLSFVHVRWRAGARAFPDIYGRWFEPTARGADRIIAAHRGRNYPGSNWRYVRCLAYGFDVAHQTRTVSSASRILGSRRGGARSSADELSAVPARFLGVGAGGGEGRGERGASDIAVRVTSRQNSANPARKPRSLFGVPGFIFVAFEVREVFCSFPARLGATTRIAFSILRKRGHHRSSEQRGEPQVPSKFQSARSGYQDATLITLIADTRALALIDTN